LKALARFLGQGKLPRSYRPGKLLQLVAVDLAQHRFEMGPPHQGRFVAQGGGLPNFEAQEEVVKNFLGHLTVILWRFSLPAPPAEPGWAVIRSSGRIRRMGIEGLTKEGDAAFSESVGRLIDHAGFARALQVLDFKRYEIHRERSSWRADVELIGASEVIAALPPMRRYIRLYPDQRSALLGSFMAMGQVLG